MRTVRGRLGLCLTLGLLGACGRAGDERVELLYAASLTAFVEDELVPALAQAEGIRLLAEPEGSLAAAHRIRDGVRRPDLYITADPATVELLGEADPGWSILFARGELVIGYAAGSRLAAVLDSARTGALPWLTPLTRPGLRLGRTDPELDPKGYRAVWLLEGAAAALPAAERAPIEAILGSRASLFPEAGLAARVEGGQLDAGVFYLAEARAHRLLAIRVPGELGQGDPDLAREYARLAYRTSAGHEVRGQPIAYALTVPSTAANPDGAARVGAWLLGPAGRRLLDAAGLPPLARRVGDPDRVPPSLRDFVRQEGDSAPGPGGEDR